MFRGAANRVDVQVITFSFSFSLLFFSAVFLFWLFLLRVCCLPRTEAYLLLVLHRRILIHSSKICRSVNEN